MAVTKLCTYIETLFTDVGYIFTNVSNGCDKNWIRELIKMSQTLLMFSLMLQPLLIQYVSNGCDKIAVTILRLPFCKSCCSKLAFTSLFTYLASNDLFKILVQKVSFLRNTTLNYLVGHRLTRHVNGEYLSERILFQKTSNIT